MKNHIEERAVAVANFIVSSNSTVRETARRFGISKSTVHKDITDRVEKIDPELAKGKTIPEIAEALEEDEDVIRRLIDEMDRG